MNGESSTNVLMHIALESQSKIEKVNLTPLEYGKSIIIVAAALLRFSVLHHSQSAARLRYSRLVMFS
jgi:hypothetical protein